MATELSLVVDDDPIGRFVPVERLLSTSCTKFVDLKFDHHDLESYMLLRRTPANQTADETAGDRWCSARSRNSKSSPMTAQSNFQTDDLVLRLTGGQRDGELIPVKTIKCFLGVEENSDEGVTERSQCAIFRGSNGATFRSYDDNVLVNGVACTVHWLKEGDRIEFPNSMTVEIAQLGCVKKTCQEQAPTQDESASARGQSRSEHTCQNDRDHQLDRKNFDNQQKPASQQESEPEMTEKECQTTMENQSLNCEDKRIELTDSQIENTQSQNYLETKSSDQLEKPLEELSEQISELVSLSLGADADTDMNEESFVTQGNPGQQTRENEEVSTPAPTTDSMVDDSTDQDVDLPSPAAYYSHLDDDDEKIMTFGPELETDEAEGLTANVETNDSSPTWNTDTQNEIDSPLSEMESVFGGPLAKTDADRNESTMEHTANEQPLDSFETPTHGLDEGPDSFADYSTTGEIDPGEPGTLASQLLEDIHSDGSQLHETEEEESVADPAPASNSTSSVADLLARMKADGQWDGIPEGDEPVETAPQPEVTTQVDSTCSTESEGDVDDYMSQLLNRMRGGEPESKPKPVVAPESVSATKAVETTEEAEFVAPANPLKSDEFKPLRKAQTIELSAMRELANSTSRHAVHASQKIRRKELGYVQIGIAVCSFFMSFYFFLTSSLFMDSGFMLGLVCISIAGFLGYRFYSTMRYNEMLETVTANKKKNDSK